MNSPATHIERAQAKAVILDLADGRTLCVPVRWYPRLAHGSVAERANWRLIGGGEGIHWPDLDEDIRVDDLLSGSPSRESEASVAAWIASRSPRS